VARRIDLLFRDLLVNGVASWAIWPGEVRRRIYKSYGMRIETGGISPGCFFGSRRVSIGTGTTVNYRCFFDSFSPIRIGRWCAIGMEVLFCTSTHELGPPEQRAGRPTGTQISVGDGCWIGARAVILPGVTIENGCVVAGGAVVTKDCAANGLYAGVPARRVKDLPEVAERNLAGILESENLQSRVA
jgi:acetyltransferase-like isoleucine patch superfamily enzyme